MISPRIWAVMPLPLLPVVWQGRGFMKPLPVFLALFACAALPACSGALTKNQFSFRILRFL
ncbi:MAG: hypothetical protein CMN05_02615 [Roseibacillus sp.]|nr:hypothetical protein [Roseibacillus sp.]MBP35316.1 hypothetical protein [Roseibacillus sp.]